MFSSTPSSTLSSINALIPSSGLLPGLGKLKYHPLKTVPLSYHTPPYLTTNPQISLCPTSASNILQLLIYLLVLHISCRSPSSAYRLSRLPTLSPPGVVFIMLIQDGIHIYYNTIEIGTTIRIYISEKLLCIGKIPRQITRFPL